MRRGSAFDLLYTKAPVFISASGTGVDFGADPALTTSQGSNENSTHILKPNVRGLDSASSATQLD